MLTTLQVVKTACDFLGKWRTSSMCVSGMCLPITWRSVLWGSASGQSVGEADAIIITGFTSSSG